MISGIVTVICWGGVTIGIVGALVRDLVRNHRAQVVGALVRDLVRNHRAQHPRRTSRPVVARTATEMEDLFYERPVVRR